MHSYVDFYGPSSSSSSAPLPSHSVDFKRPTERVCKVSSAQVSDINPLAMHSATLLLVLLQVLGSAIIFGDAFVMTQKKLSLQKDTHHRIILSGVSNDADEGGIRYEALLESREREIELIARLDPDHEQNDPSLSGDANQEIVISELWVSTSLLLIR